MKKDNILSFCASFHSEESLERVQKESTRENERRFFSEIKNAQSDNTLNPAVLNTQEGKKYQSAISELAELEMWPFSMEGVSISSFDDLKHMILEDPQNLVCMAINPFGKVLLIRQSQIAQIDTATQMAVQRVKHAAGVRLLRPKGFPPRLAGGMKSSFRQKKEVRWVYLLLAQGPEESAVHWLFLIDFDGTETSLFPEVEEFVQPYMKSGESFELIKATSELLQIASANNKPIYQRHGERL